VGNRLTGHNLVVGIIGERKQRGTHDLIRKPLKVSRCGLVRGDKGVELLA
jgi:hypothetical protein